jgi:hypothetical protein
MMKNKNKERLTECESTLTGNGRVCHLAHSADIDVNTIVNGFQAVTGTSTVIHSMVAKCWPSVNSGQHVVSACRDIVLRRSQSTGYRRCHQSIFNARII